MNISDKSVLTTSSYFMKYLEISNKETHPTYSKQHPHIDRDFLINYKHLKMIRIFILKWSFYNKTYIVIPTCTSDIAQPPIYPDTHLKHFSQCVVRTHPRCQKRTPGSHLQAAKVPLTPAHQFLVVGDQQESEGRTGGSTSNVQVSMTI